MNVGTAEIVATALFALAVIHTFLVKKFETISHRYPLGSPGSNLFHFLGEVEAVFGIWAGIYVAFLIVTRGLNGAVVYLEGINYTEPAFVFVIMAMAGTRPVIDVAEKAIVAASRLLPMNQKMSFYATSLVLGPILGSFITEPAAMTVTSLILLKNYYRGSMSAKFKYATLGLLFVNISVGGTLSHFAAPPVLMVAQKWDWGMLHMIGHFGYKSAIAILISTSVIAYLFRSELTGPLVVEKDNSDSHPPKAWVTAIHIIFLALVVMTAHHMVFFMGLFLFFIGFTTITETYQDKIKLKESLLVGFFLAGLVTLGNQQSWWLQPILSGLDSVVLYLGATGLTAITDNAALTYLGSLVELTPSAKYYLVAGAVAGGGLTVIANAPNPAGYGILRPSFGANGISPIGLLKSALFPTFVVLIALYFLPSFG